MQPSTASGLAILGAVGTQAATAPPVNIIELVTQLILAALGLYNIFRREKT